MFCWALLVGMPSDWRPSHIPRWASETEHQSVDSLTGIVQTAVASADEETSRRYSNDCKTNQRNWNILLLEHHTKATIILHFMLPCIMPVFLLLCDLFRHCTGLVRLKHLINVHSICMSVEYNLWMFKVHIYLSIFVLQSSPKPRTFHYTTRGKQTGLCVT